MNNTIRKDIIRILCNPKSAFLFEIAQFHTYRETVDSQCEGNPTMRCDGKVVEYHPDCLKWPSEKRMAVLVHEWLHTAHFHHHRIKNIPDANALAANLAADAVINPLVRSFGFKLTDGFEWPGAENKTFEQVYAEIMKRAPQKPKDGTGMMQRPSDGDGEADGESDGQGQPKDGNKPGKVGATPDTETKAKAEAALARLLNGAKQQGVLPAGAEQWLKRWTEPKVDWREVLREYCRRVSRDSWSYQRTHRSYAAMGYTVPGRYSRRAGTVVIVRDTSGSLYAKQAEVASEARAVLLECQPERLVLIDCDAAVHRVIVLQPGEDLPANALGGGGTDFRPAFDAAAEYNPEVMVFITDLYGEFPDETPDYPVIWGMIEAGNQRPPFGHHVLVD